MLFFAVLVSSNCNRQASGQVVRLNALREACLRPGAATTRWEQASLCQPRNRRRMWPSCSLVGGSGGLLWPPERGAEIDGAAAVFRLAALHTGGNLIASRALSARAKMFA